MASPREYAIRLPTGHRAEADDEASGSVAPVTGPDLPATPPTDRSAYLHHTKVQTRWRDNDVYGHVNNAVYYEYMDTVINETLVNDGGLDIHNGKVIGLCVQSHCEFLGPLSYPGDVEACLRVGHLGNSSVRYELALFDSDTGDASAVGWFVHVFVDRDSRRPTDMEPALRARLEQLLVAS